MRTRNFILLVALILVLGQVGSVSAATIAPLNARPGTIAMDRQNQMQGALDQIFGVNALNAITDQNNQAMWAAAGLPPFNSTVPILAFEFTDAVSQAAQVFGIWTAYDTNGPKTMIPIFFGPAGGATNGGPTQASLQWSDATHFSISSNAPAGEVNVGNFAGIAYNYFGFYAISSFDPNNPVTSFSSDLLNPNNRPGMLAYNYNGVAWALGFETDFGFGSTDFNDMIIKIESIVPGAVPLPASVLLMGSGLLGLVGLGGWRRRKS